MPTTKSTQKNTRIKNNRQPAADNDANDNFEVALAELEKIVRRMEQGEQSLEQTMQDFERGIILAEQCRSRLESARQRVEKLTKKHGGYKLESFNQSDSDRESTNENS